VGGNFKMPLPLLEYAPSSQNQRVKGFEIPGFGENIVPYQRRRILPQREQGELPFERMPRYGTDYRDQLPPPSGVSGVPSQGADGLFRGFEPFSWEQFLRRANWPVVTGLGALFVVLIALMLAITAISS
jgi:phycobilisome rod-core linker protein